jgi:hypothetical protein
MTLLTAALFATLATPPPQTPAQRVAAKALAGDYGKLQDWQRKGYTAILKGTQPQLLVVTGYGPWEGRDGRVDCRGNKLTLGALASNRLPQGTFVYMPTWGMLFRVVDCGAKSNDDPYKGGKLTSYGKALESVGATRDEAFWADVWLGDGLKARGRCDWRPTRAEVAK